MLVLLVDLDIDHRRQDNVNTGSPPKTVRKPRARTPPDRLPAGYAPLSWGASIDKFYLSLDPFVRPELIIRLEDVLRDPALE